MALMLRHISGKHNFDLFKLPAVERLFKKGEIKTILADFNSRRLSRQVQNRLSEVDSPMHFYNVALDVLFGAILRHGFPHGHLRNAVLELLCHRHDYKDDADMQTWMHENLVHVKYDLANDGFMKDGDCLPLSMQCLFSLEGAPMQFKDLMRDRKPLVILAGSWS